MENEKKIMGFFDLFKPKPQYPKHDQVQDTVTLPDGTKYIGEFKDGRLNGHGTLTFSNGEKYVGEFRDGSIKE